MKKLIFAILFTFSSIFVQKGLCQDGINYLEIQAETNSLSCVNLTLESVITMLEELGPLRNSKFDTGYAEYCYDLGTALHYYGIMKKNKMATLISNVYFYKCARCNTTLKGSAYHFITWNYIVFQDCEMVKRSLKLHFKYTSEEYWDKDLEDFVNTICK